MMGTVEGGRVKVGPAASWGEAQHGGLGLWGWHRGVGSHCAALHQAVPAGEWCGAQDGCSCLQQGCYMWHGDGELCVGQGGEEGLERCHLACTACSGQQIHTAAVESFMNPQRHESRAGIKI